MRSNVVLIGMPGSGKSTVGVVLAKQTARDFIDTDVIIQTSEGRPLQDIVDQDGYMALRRIEEKILQGISLRNHVIATGGSAVYSEAAMIQLKLDGIVAFLDADLPTLAARIRDFGTRGLSKSPGQSLADLYEERLPLYRRYADLVVKCGKLTHEEVCAKIIEELGVPGQLKRGAKIMFKRVDHVEIVPSDPERTIDFYVNILDFKIKSRNQVKVPPMKEVIYLQLGDTVIEVISADGPTPKSREPWQVGYRGIAIEVEDMKKAVEYLKGKGVTLLREPVDLGNSFRGEISDPDGLIIELRQWK